MSKATYPQFAVMVVDDEEKVLTAVRNVLASAGINNVLCIHDPSAVLETLRGGDTGLVLLDLSMPVLSGQELLPLIREEFPQTAVAVITGNTELEQAVECMRLGAADYLVKPLGRDRLSTCVRRLIENQELLRECMALTSSFFSPGIQHPEAFSRIITENGNLRTIMRYTETISRTSHPVLITGETGTGKELFAEAVHLASGREGEFVAVNIAGLDDVFLSDLLFGHRKGAFTGADGHLDGLMDRAENGTLFLDELGDLSVGSQVKLLRLLETGEYYPLGSSMPKRGKVRFVVSTNRDLEEAVKTGGFRKDLFYRLNTHHIALPPLRERTNDIPLLVHHFIREASEELGIAPPLPPPELLSLLRGYGFPGNLRELKQMIFDAVGSAVKGGFSIRGFRNIVGGSRPSASEAVPSFVFSSELPTLKQAADILVAEAMARSQGNQARAARLLGISPQALNKRLSKSRP